MDILRKFLFAVFAQLVSSAFFAATASGEELVATLTFAARPAKVLEREHGTSFTGHAFLIISLKTDNGVKEEVFGFYPVNGGKGVVKGPGMLKAEYRCGPNDDCGPQTRAQLSRRLSEVKESVTVPISLEGRSAVYAEIKKWDSKSFVGSNGKQVVPLSDAEYRLFDSNCIDFVAGVASRLGYPTPERSVFQTPAEFMSAFKPLALQELKVRQAKREAAEMKKRASAAEEKARRAEIAQKRAEAARQEAEIARQEAEIARQEAEKERARAQQQAETVPPGWVTCTCPHLHGAYGKVVRGALWHPSNITCPK